MTSDPSAKGQENAKPAASDAPDALAAARRRAEAAEARATSAEERARAAESLAAAAAQAAEARTEEAKAEWNRARASGNSVRAARLLGDDAQAIGRRRALNLRRHVDPVPQGRARVRWYGPGLLWMLSSVGSGSVLFTPRVGSQYGYALAWLALVVIFFQWAMIREVGRYTLMTGRSLLDGFRDVPGPRGWAVWLVFLPQLAAAVVTIAGIAALAGSALMIALPGAQWAYASGLIVVSILLVVSGRYKGVERASALLAGLLVLTALVTAVIVFPRPADIGLGLLPGVPKGFDLYFVLPWVGFILAGAAGILWFSYWVGARGYGGGPDAGAGRPEMDEAERRRRLQGWFRIVDRTALIGVLGGGIVVISFLILGAEVLQPEGVVPEGIAVAEDLTRLFAQTWGAAGRWILLLGIFVALAGTILADQDGWGRTFADATRVVVPEGRWRRAGGLLSDRRRLKNAYAIGATAVLPLAVLVVARRPVDLLSIGGIVAAAHTPVLVFLTLYLNRTQIPPELQAGRLMFWATAAAGLFFLGFACLYFADLLGWQIIGGGEGSGSSGQAEQPVGQEDGREDPGGG